MSIEQTNIDDAPVQATRAARAVRAKGSMLNLPAGTVQFYNDGPDWPTTPTLVAAETAYRESFAAGARDVGQWDMPDPDEISDAWKARKLARRSAEVFVSSAELFGMPGLDSEQIVYRAGHEVAAARTRGRCQALELAKELWWRLGDAGMSDEQILTSIIKPWVAKVEAWATTDVDPQVISPPPGPEELFTKEQRDMLNSPRRPGPQARTEGDSMSAKLVNQDEGYKFIQDRLDTEAWWIIPLATVEAMLFSWEIEKAYYRDGNAVLFDAIIVPQPTPDVPVVNIIMAAKSCMPAERLAEFVGVLPKQDILIHKSTPLSIIHWLNQNFRY